MASNNTKQEQAALLLSTGLSAVSVAKLISVAPETVSRWKSNPDFQALVNEHQTEKVTIAREQLRESAKKAASTIDSLLDSKNEAIKLKAALALLHLINVDAPAKIFAGIGSTDPLDILAEMRKQVEMAKIIFPDKYCFDRKIP
jgi:transposase-like protein